MVISIITVIITVVVLVDDTEDLDTKYEVRQPCAIQSQVDELWYRGQVEMIDEDELIEVSLVDVGRTEHTSRHALQLLQHDLLSVPVSLLRLKTHFNNRQGTTTTLCLSVCLYVSTTTTEDSLTTDRVLLQLSVCLCLSVCTTTTTQDTV